LDAKVFLGDWRDSLGNAVKVEWARPGSRGGVQLNVELARPRSSREPIRLDIKPVGRGRFTCGHYDLDTERSHAEKIVWNDCRSRGKVSVWERRDASVDSSLRRQHRAASPDASTDVVRRRSRSPMAASDRLIDGSNSMNGYSSGVNREQAKDSHGSNASTTMEVHGPNTGNTRLGCAVEAHTPQPWDWGHPPQLVATPSTWSAAPCMMPPPPRWPPPLQPGAPNNWLPSAGPAGPWAPRAPATAVQPPLHLAVDGQGHLCQIRDNATVDAKQDAAECRSAADSRSVTPGAWVPPTSAAQDIGHLSRASDGVSQPETDDILGTLLGELAAEARPVASQTEAPPIAAPVASAMAAATTEAKVTSSTGDCATKTTETLVSASPAKKTGEPAAKASPATKTEAPAAEAPATMEDEDSDTTLSSEEEPPAENGPVVEQPREPSPIALVKDGDGPVKDGDGSFKASLDNQPAISVASGSATLQCMPPAESNSRDPRRRQTASGDPKDPRRRPSSDCAVVTPLDGARRKRASKSSASAGVTPPSSSVKNLLPGPTVFEWFPVPEGTGPSIVAAMATAAPVPAATVASMQLAAPAPPAAFAAPTAPVAPAPALPSLDFMSPQHAVTSTEPRLPVPRPPPGLLPSISPMTGTFHGSLDLIGESPRAKTPAPRHISLGQPAAPAAAMLPSWPSMALLQAPPQAVPVAVAAPQPQQQQQQLPLQAAPWRAAPESKQREADAVAAIFGEMARRGAPASPPEHDREVEQEELAKGGNIGSAVRPSDSQGRLAAYSALLLGGSSGCGDSSTGSMMQQVDAEEAPWRLRKRRRGSCGTAASVAAADPLQPVPAGTVG